MKVAIVSPYDLGRHGGVQDQTIRLTGWLEDAGHEAVLVGPGTAGPPGAVLLGRTTVVRANRSATPIRLDPLIGRKLRRALGSCDVIHVHEPLMPAVSHGALRVPGPAKVATFHADPPRWVRVGYRAARPLHRRLLRRVDVATAVSPVAAHAAAGLVECRIIPNGIDVASYRNGPKVPGRVVFVGRDDERKGLSVLLHAWPTIRDAVPGAALVVVGAERREAIPGVTFLGRVSEERKRDELAAAEVMAAPNLGGESFGIVVLEAMAAGCAVVASGLPAFARLLDVAGRLVAPGDEGGMAGATVDLLDNDDHRRRLGAAALDRSKGFDGSVVAAGYLTAYRDAAGRR